MNIFKNFFSYFDSISHEIKLMNIKACGIFSALFLFSGIITWILSGKADELVVFLIAPRAALPLPYAYILWAIFFAFTGMILGGILFGCEKFKRQRAYKAAIFIVLMQLFSLCIYPMFFSVASPLLSFICCLVALMFCILTIMASIKAYALWTLCLFINFLWLLYNSYVSLAFVFVN